MILKKLLKNQDGFSIVSALVSFMILGLALIGLLNLMIATVVTGNFSTRDSRASYLLESKIEELKTMGYKHLSQLVEVNGGRYTGEETIEDTYTVSWEVKQSNLQANSLRIDVKVTYPSPNQGLRTLERITLKSDYD